MPANTDASATEEHSRNLQGGSQIGSTAVTLSHGIEGMRIKCVKELVALGSPG